MSDKPISDNESIQKLLSDIENMTQLAKHLKSMGLLNDKAEARLHNLEALHNKAKELSQISDRFNDHFSKNGWIAYENMNLDTMLQAIELADSGQTDQAETLLVEYYSSETVKFWLQQMNKIQAFKPRMRLARLALKDYEEERYHACIPVLLALIDGLVNDLNDHKGFFADITELEAWNSISAHKKGLVELGNIFKTGRNKTRQDNITIPYRNGIIHGTDLGYDNRIVAAKTWGALFALYDWALKAEAGKLEQSDAENISIDDMHNKIKENAETKRLSAEWQPREIAVGSSFPISGNPEEYNSDSPEKKLVEFLHYWKNKNYGYMAKCIPLSPGKTEGQMPKAIKEIYENVELYSFEIMSCTDVAAPTTEIEVKLEYNHSRLGELTKNFTYRLLYLNSNGKSEIRSVEGHHWYIMNWNYITFTTLKKGR